MTTYQIETRSTTGNWDGHVGDGNAFATQAEAEAAIGSLRAMGDEWASAEYRVVEIATDAATASRECKRAGAGGLVASTEDPGCVTVRAIPDADARRLAASLRRLCGCEVSTAPDNDDRALSWVYVDVSPDSL